ncbi:MAG: zf-HC2 domain-containing protein [Planctomycetota bacterium]
MTCTEFDAELDDYVDGQLDDRHRVRFDAHVAACDTCREHVREAREFSETLRASIQSFGNTIQPPSGAKDVVKAIARHQTMSAPQRSWRWALGVAALVAIGLLVFIASRMGQTSKDDDHAALSDEYVRLYALQLWQNSLAANADACGSDPALLTVACAYLPASKRSELLRHVGKTPESLAADWQDRSELVVRLQRSSRKGTRVSELTFEQWSDGRVHVEHVVRNGDDSTTTKLDAGAWDILNAQNPELCRQLDLVDEHGKLLVGLPLPSAETLRRDTLTALRDGGAPPDLVKRLLQLRLATRVKSQAELEAVLHVEPTHTTPVVAPPTNLEARVAELEKETAAGVKTVVNVAETESYFKKLCAN